MEPKQPDAPAIIGIDEAGRGCIAGPVVAAAVLLPASFCLPGLDDSKKLSPAMRARLAPAIKLNAAAWGIGIIWQQRIDRINILQATFEAMARAAASALAKTHCRQALLLIDGDKPIPESRLAGFLPSNMALPSQKAVIRGDALIPAVSAASILAKTCRDRIMRNLARIWPDYDFERHKGYGTAAHYEALRAAGPCPLHRLTFRGVADGKR